MKATWYSFKLPQEGQLIYYGAGAEHPATDDAVLHNPKVGRWQCGSVVSATMYIENFTSYNNCWAPYPETRDTLVAPATITQKIR